MTAANEYSLGELAKHLHLDDASKARVKEKSSFVIRGIEEVFSAQEDQITFVNSEKYVRGMETSHAGVIIVNHAIDKAIPAAWKENKIILTVPDSKIALARISHFFSRESWGQPGIHASAVIAPSAKIGKNVRIGAHTTIEIDAVVEDNVVLQAGTYIGQRVHIGAESVLFPNVVIYADCRVGKRARIHANTVIGADGFGYAQEKTASDVQHLKIQHLGRVLIGDDVEIGASSTIDRGTLGDTQIGRGTKIDNQVQIGHNTTIGENVIICGNTGIAGSVNVGKNVIIAGLCGIGNGAEIGDGAMIGGMTGIQSTVPPMTVWAGNPARPKVEHFKIQGILGHLPEMYKEFRRLMKSSGQKQQRREGKNNGDESK